MVFSFMSVLVWSETGLFCKGAAAGLDSMGLSCGCCLYRDLEEGGSTSVSVPNNGRLGSGTFGKELEEVKVVVSSFLAVLVLSEMTDLLLLGVMEGVVSLPTRLSTMSTSHEVALPVAEGAVWGSSFFKEGS